MKLLWLLKNCKTASLVEKEFHYIVQWISQKQVRNKGKEKFSLAEQKSKEKKKGDSML